MRTAFATVPSLADGVLTPLSTPNLPERIADRMIEAVARRRLLPGQRLIETELSEQLAVSRIPLREALRTLQSQGIVTALPRRGVRLIGFDDNWAREVYDVRVALERMSSHAAARRLRNDAASRVRLEACLAELRRVAASGDMFALNSSDLAFHTVIYDLSDSPLLQTLWSAISRHVLVLFSIETYRFQDPGRIVAEHVDLLRALLTGSDAEIDAEVARHVAGQGCISGGERPPRLGRPPAA